MWCNPYYFAHLNSVQGTQIILNVVVNTIILPLLIIVGIKKLGLLDDIELTVRKQRAIPYLVLIFFFFWNFIVFLKQDFPPAFVSVMLGAVLGLFAAYIVNILYFKISLHAIGAGAFFATVLYGASLSIFSLKWPLIICLIAGGVIGTSRLYLKAHQPIEIYFGYLLGFLAQILAYYIL